MLACFCWRAYFAGDFAVSDVPAVAEADDRDLAVANVPAVASVHAVASLFVLYLSSVASVPPTAPDLLYCVVVLNEIVFTTRINVARLPPYLLYSLSM